MGVYSTDGRIVFASRPANEWEFMATGTGVTGITVTCAQKLIFQFNHSAGIDETGAVRALGRMHLDLAGSPFASGTAFRMEHDLRRSVIDVMATTPTGSVQVSIRASIPDDAVQLQVEDQRTIPGPVRLWFEDDAPMHSTVALPKVMVRWHENPPTGSGINNSTRAWLAGRAFGLAVNATAGNGVECTEHEMRLPAVRRQSVYVLGLSTPAGVNAFERILAARLAQARRGGDEGFIARHAAWWQLWGERSSFEPIDASGRLVRYKAAFDLYRYYMACAAGDHRETPVRFQMDAFRYHLRQHDWLTYGICAVELYQGISPCLRTGDWEALRSQFHYYGANLPHYQHLAASRYGTHGAAIPMAQTPWLITPPGPLSGVKRPASPQINDVRYNGENPAGSLFMLALMCDYVDVSGDDAFANAILHVLAKEVMTCFRERYPHTPGQPMTFYPCNAGETWQFVKNPTEVVCAYRMALTRLLEVGERLGWNEDLSTWRTMLEATPPIPRGTLQGDANDPCAKPELLPGNLLVPAEDMGDCHSYELPWTAPRKAYRLNRQHTELYAIWPCKMVLRHKVMREIARKSYEARRWPHLPTGWALDVVFAACLGLTREVSGWFDKHFQMTYTLPCGLAFEEGPVNPKQPSLPECPSLQGMGTGMVSVVEMLMQDYPDELILLPCWPPDIPVKFSLYSPFAGKVEVQYMPNTPLRVMTEKEINVRVGWDGATPSDIQHTVRNHPKTSSRWQGKTWNTLGDSITDVGLYQKKVKALLGFDNVINYGKTATEICDGKSAQSSDQAIYGLPMSIRYAEMNTTADLVTILGGTNDFGHNQPLGTMTSTTVSTFYGALKIMLGGIIAAHPAAKVVIFTPLQRTFAGDAGVTGMTNQLGLQLVDYVDAIIEVAALYSVPVLDLYRCSGIMPENAIDFLADGLHPNDAGYEKIANAMAHFLTTLGEPRNND
jgi:lysophospholipase L1-like esterase